MTNEGKSWYTNFEKIDVTSREDIIHDCFVTGEQIAPDDDAYWTGEFDAWISERGYQMIMNEYSTGELSREHEIIYGEWYAKDEAQTGLEEQWHSEWMSHMEYKHGHGYRHDEL